MRKMVPISIFIIALLAGDLACKRVIEVDLHNAPAQIVIEGNVTDGPGPYRVRISRTVPFSASNTFPPVNGATVQLTDSNSAVTETLVEKDTNGIYTTTAITGKHGHTYFLTVMNGGVTYRASCTMPVAVRLDSVSFVQNLDLSNQPAINAVANFQDPPGIGNKYQFTEFVNNVQVPQIFVFEDRLSDGRYIRNTLYNDTVRLHRFDTVAVNLFCIDPKIYQYFFTLMQIAGNPNFQTASPANPVSNFDHGALGYFSAHTVSRIKLVIN